MNKLYAGLMICAFGLFCGSAIAADDRPAKRTFSLVVREGFGSIAVGDLNTTLNSTNHNAVYDMMRQLHPERCVGEILEVPTTFTNWEAELQWNFWKGFSVGVSVAGPTRYFRKSFLTYTIVDYAGVQTMEYTWEPEIRASAPLKATLYYSLPILSKLSIMANGGVGYYRARMIVNEVLQERVPLDQFSITSWLIEATGHAVGFHGGFALEYKFNGRFSVILDNQWRFAKITSLTGSMNLTGTAFDAMGNPLSVPGSQPKYGFLYHLTGEDLFTGARIEKLGIEDFPPPWWGVDMPADIRHAFLDLSGYTFSIGLRIKLF